MSVYKEPKPYPPYADLVIVGKNLDPEIITNMLEIIPSRSHKKNDKKKDGIREFSNGVWELSSQGQQESVDVNDHLNWLTNQLLPVKNILTLISSMEEVEIIRISIFWIMPSTNEVLILEPELLRKLAEFEIQIVYDIYAPNI